MKVLCDFHHEALWRSWELLFEKRLGWKLFRPMGMDWFNKGYWKIAEPYGNYIGTVKQYLDPRDKDRHDLTFDRVKEMDIVIASIPGHIIPYSKLAKQHGTKFVFQMGNHFPEPIDWSIVKNLMSSTSPFSVPSDVNKVFYHQEFDLNVFNYEPPTCQNKVYSFVHCLKEKAEDYSLYQQYKKAMFDYDFRSYGAGCDDGNIGGFETVAKKMKEASFGFHLKAGGDGFGHTIFNWFSIGRPVIVKESQYRGKLAGELMINGKTCIDLERGGIKENIERMRKLGESETHRWLCLNAHKRFLDIVDFDKEFLEIKKFLEKLK